MPWPTPAPADFIVCEVFHKTEAYFCEKLNYIPNNSVEGDLIFKVKQVMQLTMQEVKDWLI